MNKLIKICITTFITSSLFVGTGYASNYTELDTKNGFKDMTFDKPISEFKGLKLVEDGGNSKYYQRDKEDLKVGDYILDKIVYSFYKGKLSGIYITTKGLTNSRGFLDILKKAYGNPFKGNRYIERYLWSGDVVALMYSENSLTHDADISIINKQISAIENNDKNQSDNEAVKDL